MTLGRRELDALLVEHGLEPSRALGQNFVADPNTVRRIARLAGVGPGDHVLEIGAGLGSLTLALAETGAAVTAVEVDRHLEPVLRSVVEPVGVRVVLADAMAADWDSILGAGGAPASWVLVANLPYNVATPLVLDLLDETPAIVSMLVMVQREVAERLAAPPGSRTFGLPSLKVGYWATAEVVGTVPATVFIPRPRVESALVRIVRRPEPAVPGDPEPLFSLARQAFSQRRKMLRRSLSGRVDDAMFTAAAVAPDARPEVLDLAAWARLRDAVLATRSGTGPETGSDTGSDAAAGVVLMTVHLVAPAKLTLSLRVTGVRADGFHLIDAEMVSLDLADELELTEHPRAGAAGRSSLTVVDAATGEPHAVGAGADNLVTRALHLAGRDVSVRLRKRIPPGAGLGGGSSDAAAVLRWAGWTDLEAAARLGADVAYCLVGGRARVRGIGEEVDPLPFAARTLTLLTPPFGCATPAVYRAWDELGGPVADGPNDLEPAALAVEPRLARYRDVLGDVPGQTPRLAGSGSTWFVDGAHPGDGRIVATTVPAPHSRR